MGLFGKPFDADVEKATSDKNTEDEWGPIMDVCDKVGTSAANAKDCLRAIVKRLGNQDPHVVMQAITLLDACANNCGRNFHLEIASREFETDYRRLLKSYPPAVSQKFKALLKKWSEGEFKSDSQLNLIPSLMNKLKSEGEDFSDLSDAPAKKKEHVSTTPSLRQQEQEQLDRAIELSLQETKQSSPRNSATSSNTPVSSLYPTMSQISTATPAQEVVKVRALYDFEAAEDNELTFSAGEIIHVSDSSDPNWWKGYNQRGDGLFPANFVTTDLSVEPQPLKTERKSVQFNESVDVKNIERSNSPDPDEPVEINEAKIDRLISLLHEANPEDSSTDTQEMLYLENEVNRMGPLIDMELEKIDRKHAHLTQLSADLVDALNLYHTLMREPTHKQPAGQYPPPMHQMYNGTSLPYGTPSMPTFYMPPPHNVGPVSGMMGPGPAGNIPGQMMPSGMLPHHPQQVGPASIGPIGLTNALPHLPHPVAIMSQNQGGMPPHSYASIQQPGAGPPSGMFHPAPPPGQHQNFVM